MDEHLSEALCGPTGCPSSVKNATLAYNPDSMIQQDITSYMDQLHLGTENSGKMPIEGRNVQDSHSISTLECLTDSSISVLTAAQQPVLKSTSSKYHKTRKQYKSCHLLERGRQDSPSMSHSARRKPHSHEPADDTSGGKDSVKVQSKSESGTPQKNESQSRKIHHRSELLPIALPGNRKETSSAGTKKVAGSKKSSHRDQLHLSTESSGKKPIEGRNMQDSHSISASQCSISEPVVGDFSISALTAAQQPVLKSTSSKYHKTRKQHKSCHLLERDRQDSPSMSHSARRKPHSHEPADDTSGGKDSVKVRSKNESDTQQKNESQSRKIRHRSELLPIALPGKRKETSLEGTKKVAGSKKSLHWDQLHLSTENSGKKPIEGRNVQDSHSISTLECLNGEPIVTNSSISALTAAQQPVLKSTSSKYHKTRKQHKSYPSLEYDRQGSPSMSHSTQRKPHSCEPACDMSGGKHSVKVWLKSESDIQQKNQSQSQRICRKSKLSSTASPGNDKELSSARAKEVTESKKPSNKKKSRYKQASMIVCEGNISGISASPPHDAYEPSSHKAEFHTSTAPMQALVNLTEDMEKMKIFCISKHDSKIAELEKNRSKIRTKGIELVELDIDKVEREKEDMQNSFAESNLRKKAFLSYCTELEGDAEEMQSEPLKLTPGNVKILCDRFDRECRRYDKALPIYAQRSNILKMISEHQTCILIGETGSGKSTQVVQYLYEAGYAENGIIACIQPRKLAALSLAQHVCKEVCESIGDTYAFAATHVKQRKSTKVVFMTDHSLLNECIADTNLSKYSCLVIDEAQERSIHTDILIALIKRCLPKRQDLKIVITSATINPTLFSSYFGGHYECPVIKVSGRTYPVDVFWEQCHELPIVERDYVSDCVTKAFDIHIRKKGQQGDILVFLTGPSEIERACRLAHNTFKNETIILPLHGKLQSEEQQKVFEVTQGKRKIVFSTNVAETSVTIPGIKYVVDTGLSKEMCYDPQKNMNSLEIRPISKSSANQRKGRAGRTSPGECHCLYTMDEYASMRDDSVPEILRITLAFAVLKLYEFGIDDIHSFEFVDAPDRKALDDAVANLKFLGAIKAGKLSKIGRRMAMLPLQPNLSKVLLDAIEQGVGTEGAAAAAISTLAGRVFFRPSKDELKGESDIKRLPFCQVGGDQMTHLHTYFEWSMQDKKERNKWCIENYVNGKSMKMVEQLVGEIRLILAQRCGIHLSPMISSLEKAETIIPQLYFNAFLQNLCVHMGHDRIGYWCENLCTEQLQLHPGSSLHYLNSIPQFIIFEQIHKTSQHFLLQVLPVCEKWILNAVKSGTIPCHPAESSLYKFYCVSSLCFTNIGQTVFSRLLGKYHSDRRKQVPEFRAFDVQPLFQYSRECGEFHVFAQDTFHDQIKQSVESFVDDVKTKLKSESKEDGIVGSNDDVRIILGEGGSIQHILMPDEFLSIMVRGLSPCSLPVAIEELKDYGECTIEEHEQKFDKTIQLFIKFLNPEDASRALSHTFIGFDEPNVVIHRKSAKNRNLFRFKVDVKTKLKSESKEDGIVGSNDDVRIVLGEGGSIQYILMPDEFLSIMVRGLSPCSLPVAIEELKDYCECTLQEHEQKFDKIFPIFIKFLNPEDASRALSHTFKGFDEPNVVIHRKSAKNRNSFRLKVEWPRRIRRNYAYIHFDEGKYEPHFVSLNDFPQSRLRFRNNGDRCSLKVMNITADMDESFVKSRFQSHCPSFTKVKFIFLYGDAPDPDQYVFERQYLDDLLSQHVPRTSYYLDFRNPKPKSVLYRAFVNFDDSTDCLRARRIVNLNYRYKAEMLLSSSVRYSPQVFSVIESSVNGIAQAAAPGMISNKRDRWGNVFINIKANAMDEFTRVRDEIASVVQPCRMFFSGCKSEKYISTSCFRKAAQKVQKETSTYVKLALYDNTLEIYGSVKNRELAKESIETHLNDLLKDNINVFVIELKNHGPGTMKNLILQYGPDVEKLTDEYEGITAMRLGPKKQILTLFSTDVAHLSFLESLDSSIESCRATQQALVQGANSGATIDCCVCFEPHDSEKNFFRLECCGHIYCKDCIELQLASASVIFPVTCASNNCGEKFVWKDFENLFKRKLAKLQDIKSSALRAFVVLNSQVYHHCTTPDCDMVYLITADGSRFVCGQCGANICSHCHCNWHEGYDTCFAFKKSVDMDGDTHTWVNRNCKRCPSCSVPIEKNGGCRKIRCRCGANFCWICLQYYTTEGECYDHLSAEHGGIFETWMDF